MGVESRKLQFRPGGQQALLAVMLATLFGTVLHGQEIRIRVLDGRNGHPITSECVNVWIGPVRDALLLPTNKDGVAVVHIGQKQVTGDTGFPRACKRTVFGGPQPTPEHADSIKVTSGGPYVDCQPPEKKVAPAWPSYSVREILESGVAAGNTCGKFTTEPRRGELIFFVRPVHWWEAIRW